MNKVLISLFSGALALGVIGASSQAGSPPSQSQTAAPPQTSEPTNPTQSGKVTRIAPGSVIPVSLTKTIDARKAKAGDTVVAKVTQDMKSKSGEVVFAKDTKVMGHVTEAQARNKEQKESQIGIAFDRALMRDGSQMQIPMSIQAVIAQQNDQNNGGGGYVETAAPGASPGAAGSGRSGMAGSAMGASPPASMPIAPSNASDASGEANSGAKRAPITAQTEGVVGISNLTLSPLASPSAPASVLSSEKNNVKLESGTLMLLRVNQ
jgi:hypothetical protein